MGRARQLSSSQMLAKGDRTAAVNSPVRSRAEPPRRRGAPQRGYFRPGHRGRVMRSKENRLHRLECGADAPSGLLHGLRPRLADGRSPRALPTRYSSAATAVRRMLGAAHDEWDAQAGTVHTLPITLDELHDPKRVWSLGSENPAELEAEIIRLRAELGAYRERSSPATRSTRATARSSATRAWTASSTRAPRTITLRPISTEARPLHGGGRPAPAGSV